MANRTETATLVMSLRDEMSGPAGKLATTLDKVKAAELGLAKESDALNAAAKRLAEFGRLDARLDTMNAKLAAERVEMRELGAAILAADKPTKAMEARYRTLERSADALTGQIGKQRTAVDEARAAFEKAAGPLDSMASAEARLQTRLGETTEAIRRQMRASVAARAEDERAIKAQGEMLAARKHYLAELKSMGSDIAAASGFMGGGFAAFSIGEHAARAGAVLATEQQRFKDAGPTAEAHLPEAMKVSQEVANSVPGTTQAENLRVINETRTAFGGIEEAIKNLKRVQTIAQAIKIATGGKLEVPAEELGQALGKILEMRGAAMDDAEFQRQGDAMVRAIVGTSGRLTPQKYLAFAQGAGRGTVANLSTRFITEAAPTLIGDTNSPETVGTALKGLRQIFMGHLSSKTQGEEWAKLIPGFNRDKAHLRGMSPGWEVGAIPDTQLALTDPDKWIDKYILGIGEDGQRLPDSAAARAGIDIKDQLQVSQLIGRLAPKVGGGQSMLEALAQDKSRQQLAADAPQYREAHGAEQIVDDHAVSDAAQAVKNVNTSIEDLFSTLTGGMMPGVAQGLDTLTGAIHRLNEASEGSPAVRAAVDIGFGAAGLTATGLSALAGKWAFGKMFGGGVEAASAAALDGSAMALDKAALALETAAGRLGVAGAATAAEGAAGGAAPGIVSRLLPAVGAGIPIVGAGIFVADAMLNHRDPSKALVDGGRPDALTVNDNNSMLPGFATGGYTGDGGTSDVAGVVHGRELVLHADATSRFRRVAEAMNAGSAQSIDLSGALGGGLASGGSTERAILVQAVSDGMFQGLERLLNTRGEGVFGGEAGAGYGGGGGAGGGVANLRYGRTVAGGHRSTPGTGSYGDPSKSLLDLIAKSEGAGYNVSWGNGRFLPGGHEQNLTGKTLNEILALGDTMRRQPGARNSSALGRYQITGSTLRDLMGRLHLSGGEKFDEAMQDRLASKLISDEGPRALGRWEGLKRGSYMAQAQALLRSGSVASRPDAAPTATAAGPDGIAGHVRGTLKLGDESFAYGSGGVRGSAHIPYGDYPINPDAPGAWGRAHNAMAVNNDGSIWDASLGRMRTGIEMHIGHSANLITEGCLAFLKDDYPRLKARVREMVAKTGHAYLHVGPNGASITPEAQRDAERAVLPRRAPAGASPVPERHAAGIDFDHSSIDAAIAKVDTLHGKLHALRATASVDINHRHRHEGDIGGGPRPGALRTALNGGYASDGRSWS